MKSSPPKMIAKRHENTMPEKVVFKNMHPADTWRK